MQCCAGHVRSTSRVRSFVLDSVFDGKGIFDPLERAVLAPRRERDHVEARRAPRCVAMALQIMQRRRRERGLLAVIDTFRAARELAIAAITHLDEHQRLAVIHDEIDLAVAAAVIALTQTQALRLEVTQGARLFCLSLVARARVRRHCVGAGPGSAASATGAPLLKRAHINVRCTRWSLSMVSRPVAPSTASLLPMCASFRKGARRKASTPKAYRRRRPA